MNLVDFSLGEIPLVTIYSGKTENLVSKPPLLDIAYLNLAHFQRQADLIHSLHVASQPMLVMEGYDDQTKDLLYLLIMQWQLSQVIKFIM